MFKHWIMRIKQYSQKCLESGYVSPPRPIFRRVAHLIARLWTYIQVGKVTIIGKENLYLPGRFIFCQNHRCMLDGPVVYSTIARNDVYFMGAYEEMQGNWGLRAIVLAAAGVFAVDREKGKTVIPSAAKVLVDGKCIAMFPESKISKTGECFPLKMGPAVIGFEALEQLAARGKAGEKVGIVPVYAFYHHPDDETAVKYFREIGFKWRGGITIEVGTPIYLNDFPDHDNPALVMEKVQAFICRGSTRVQVLGCPCEDD